MSEQNGKPADWMRTVVDQYEGRLLRYAGHLLGNAEHARDVVQETFCRLCREEASQVDGHVAEWLFTVCRRRALDVLRKEKRMTTLTETLTHDEPFSRDAEPDSRAEQQDETQRLLRLVERLPANQREVVRLKFQEGLSYKEISRVTELSVSNVGFLIHTAIKRLREQIGE